MQPFFLPLALSFLGTAVAQQLNTCNPGWEWTYNTLGQTPCLVTAFLNQTCDGECACSPVIYSLTSACDACQGTIPFDWDDWYLNHGCNSSVILLDVPIPPTTRVPHWAYDAINGTNPTWNSTIAQAAGDLPESTAAALPSPSLSFAPLPSASSSSASTTDSSSHGLSKGAKAAIAGGVVGGALALLLILVLVNRRRTRAAGAGFRERVRARYFDMKVGPRGLESVRMQEGPFGQKTNAALPEKSAV